MKTQYLCPACEGEMHLITAEGAWICQRPCGFQSSTGPGPAWAMLYSLIAQHRQLMAHARLFDAAAPGHSISLDFERFLEHQEP